MIDASKMNFEEWLAAKQEEEKRITHGAEVVPYDTDSGLYHLQGAILRICFNDKMRFMNLYFIPPELDWGSVGLYGHGRIMISKTYYEEHGIDDDVISTMFHECCHAWDALRGKKDTDVYFHNEVFKETCVLHGGYANYTGKIDGYNDAHPTEKTMSLIYKDIHSSRKR